MQQASQRQLYKLNPRLQIDFTVVCILVIEEAGMKEASEHNTSKIL